MKHAQLRAGKRAGFVAKRDEAKHGREADTDQKASEQNWFAADKAWSLIALSWPLPIMCMTSMPMIRFRAQPQVLKPSIGGCCV